VQYLQLLRQYFVMTASGRVNSLLFCTSIFGEEGVQRMSELWIGAMASVFLGVFMDGEETISNSHMQRVRKTLVLPIISSGRDMGAHRPCAQR
jgi:hypothetical protein